jgi:hypothetical protein
MRKFLILMGKLDCFNIDVYFILREGYVQRINIEISIADVGSGTMF